MNLELKTSPEDFAGEHEILERIFKEGLDCLHVSKPEKTSIALESWLMGLNFKYHNRVIVHNDLRASESFTLKGVAVKDPSEEELIGMLALDKGDDFKRLLITDNVSDAENAIKGLKRGVNGVIFNPVFDSLSDFEAKSSFKLKEIKELLKSANIGEQASMPTYAMGGVDDDNLEKLYSLGFGSAILCGAVWNSVWAEDCFTSLQNQVKKYG